MKLSADAERDYDEAKAAYDAAWAACQLARKRMMLAKGLALDAHIRQAVAGRRTVSQGEYKGILDRWRDGEAFR